MSLKLQTKHHALSHLGERLCNVFDTTVAEVDLRDVFWTQTHGVDMIKVLNTQQNGGTSEIWTTRKFFKNERESMTCLRAWSSCSAMPVEGL